MKRFRFLILAFVVCSMVACAKKETPLPARNYFKDYVGTYTGFLFPGERISITKESNLQAKSIYMKGNKAYEFKLLYDNDIDISYPPFFAQVLYCRIDSSMQIYGGKKDYDSLNIGIQNAKFSKTSVIGEDTSFQFSLMIDSIIVTRSFSK